MYCSSEISADCPCWEILLACYAMEYLASAGPGAGPLEDVILIFLAAVSLEAPRRAPRAASHAVYGYGRVPTSADPWRRRTKCTCGWRAKSFHHLEALANATVAATDSLNDA
jgi:hypothetical protein